MNKKQILNKLNSQKGITSADVLIALTIILSAVSVIGMIYVNLNSTSLETDRKTGATRIATNIIENISGVYYDQVQNLNSSINGAEQNIFNTKIPNGYSVQIALESPKDDEGNEITNDIVKKVTVKVYYNKNDTNEYVELSKVIEREIVRECNSPNFEKMYIEQLVGQDVDYQLYNPDQIETGKKIICPIKYDGENYSIVTGDSINSLWYSYSNKQWARVLVFDADVNSDDYYGKYINTTNHIVSDLSCLTNEKYSYVWVPRFKILNNEDSSKKIYFMYKDTNYAILAPTGEKVYNSINIKNELFDNSNLETVFPEIEGEQIALGQWFPYSDIKNSNDTENPAYKLYNSEYGPLFEY